MWQHYIAIGDSFMAGTGDPVHGLDLRGWPDRLADLLRRAGSPALQFANHARYGALTAEVLRAQLPLALAPGTDLVSLSAGANDILSGKWRFDRVTDALEEMISAVTGHGATLIVNTLPDWPYLQTLPDRHQTRARHRAEELNGWIRATATRYGAHCLELWRQPETLDPAIWSADGLHPNARGYARIAVWVAKHLLRIPVPTAPWGSETSAAADPP